MTRSASAFRGLVALGLLFLTDTAFAPSASAGSFTLADGNTVVDIDTTSQAGLYNWFVDGVDQMWQEWNWYRVGANGPEISLDTIEVLSTASDVNGNGLNETLYAKFSDGSLQFEVTWNIVGGAPGSLQSIISETYKVTNLTGAKIDDINFFTYTDLDMGGGIVDALAFLENDNSIHQYDGIWRSETTHNPNWSRWEISVWPTLLNSLNDGAATDLSNSVTPVIGPVDIVQAYQYHFNLDAGLSATFGVQKTIWAIPEPGSIAMVGVGLLGLSGLAIRRRRNR